MKIKFTLVFSLLFAGLPTLVVAQEEITSRDVIYGHKDGMAMVYDVAVPSDNANGAGIIFVISGGFFSAIESQQMIAPVAKPMLDAGFTIFYLRHPSTPKYLAPEIYAALQLGRDHILTNAEDFGVAPTKIGTLGMSTGGLLALLLAVDQPGDARSRPATTVAYMPITDIRPHVGNVRATPSLGFDPALAPALSPIDFASADDPPILFIHGSLDQVVSPEDSKNMYEKLRMLGVETQLLSVEAGHELFTGNEKELADSAALEWFTSKLLQ